jgi:ubiquinone/menaquinone biosynthesis C-methylase UbiE
MRCGAHGGVPELKRGFFCDSIRRGKARSSKRLEGERMTHKFDARNMSRLDDAKRNTLLPARDILLAAGLKPGHTFLDVGAGTGYFTFPASEIVGEKGKAIAVDISDEMIRELEARVLAKTARNIEIRKSEEYDIMIAEGIVDLALMCAVLHEIDDKPRFLANLKEALKPAGRLCIIEWQKRAMEMGPPLQERLGLEETSELLTRIGLEVVKEKEYNNVFYCVTGARR